MYQPYFYFNKLFKWVISSLFGSGIDANLKGIDKSSYFTWQIFLNGKSSILSTQSYVFAMDFNRNILSSVSFKVGITTYRSVVLIPLLCRSFRKDNGFSNEQPTYLKYNSSSVYLISSNTRSVKLSIFQYRRSSNFPMCPDKY